MYASKQTGSRPFYDVCSCAGISDRVYGQFLNQDQTGAIISCNSLRLGFFT